MQWMKPSLTARVDQAVQRSRFDQHHELPAIPLSIQRLLRRSESDSKHSKPMPPTRAAESVSRGSRPLSPPPSLPLCPKRPPLRLTPPTPTPATNSVGNTTSPA